MIDPVLCDLAAAAYTAAPAYQREDCYAVRTDIDGETIIAFRGTNDVRSALQDAKAWPRWDSVLGFCHRGFLADARAIFPAMLADLRGCRVVLTGHSKGGAEALLVGALFAAVGLPVSGIVTFGSPRAGFKKFCAALRLTAVRQYRLGADPITETPWLMGLYRHPRPLRQLEAPWSLDPFADHHVQAYRRALRRTKTLTRAAIERPFS